MTYTKEETKLKIIPVELGARYLIKVGNGCSLFPYIGAGAGYYMYKEENVIGTVDEKKIGFFAEGGLRFYLMSSFFIDAKVKNVFLKVDDLQLGGFAFMCHRYIFLIFLGPTENAEKLRIKKYTKIYFSVLSVCSVGLMIKLKPSHEPTDDDDAAGHVNK